MEFLRHHLVVPRYEGINIVYVRSIVARSFRSEMMTSSILLRSPTSATVVAIKVLSQATPQGVWADGMNTMDASRQMVKGRSFRILNIITRAVVPRHIKVLLWHVYH
jgi:hypothetical protein